MKRCGAMFLFNALSPLERSLIGVLSLSSFTLDTLGEVQVLGFPLAFVGLGSTKDLMRSTYVMHFFLKISP